MGRKSRQRLYQFVDALVETGARKLVADELLADSDMARSVMREIAHSICNQYARSMLYVPADLEFSLSKRDVELWEKYGSDGAGGERKFSPQRVAQLADEYRLTTQQIYCILRLMSRRELEARQSCIPGLDSVDDALA
ncbi:MAG TPA: Mor transcription activator family protein [Rubrivivax sp.]|nr:Mor transcription activator family protein [Rubrivivax sp.]HRY88015.1 Mor transcription activator family protein [Rubrivivax sp.]